MSFRAQPCALLDELKIQRSGATVDVVARHFQAAHNAAIERVAAKFAEDVEPARLVAGDDGALIVEITVRRIRECKVVRP